MREVEPAVSAEAVLEQRERESERESVRELVRTEGRKKQGGSERE